MDSHPSYTYVRPSTFLFPGQSPLRPLAFDREERTTCRTAKFCCSNGRRDTTTATAATVIQQIILLYLKLISVPRRLPRTMEEGADETTRRAVEAIHIVRATSLMTSPKRTSLRHWTSNHVRCGRQKKKPPGAMKRIQIYPYP